MEAAADGNPRTADRKGSAKTEAPGGLAQLVVTEVCLTAAGDAVAGSIGCDAWKADVNEGCTSCRVCGCAVSGRKAAC